MKVCKGKVIRKLRKDMKLTQEDFAEMLGISRRNLTRMENGEIDVDLWRFIMILEMSGNPSEDFWLMYIDSRDYEDYSAYRHIKRLLRDNNYNEALELIKKIEHRGLAKYPYINQFIAFAKILTNDACSAEVTIKRLEEVLFLIKPKFDWDKLFLYRFNYNEINIVCLYASKVFDMGETGKAIRIMKALIENRDISRTTLEDKAALFPAMLFTLSNMLGKCESYRESLTVCEEALRISRAFKNMRLIPAILYNLACCHHKLGLPIDQIKPILEQAYYCAQAHGDHESARIIKDDAQESFGIILD